MNKYKTADHKRGLMYLGIDKLMSGDPYGMRVAFAQRDIDGLKIGNDSVMVELVDGRVVDIHKEELKCGGLDEWEIGRYLVDNDYKNSLVIDQ